MKLAITYLLLFVYSTSALRTLLPYTSDIIAHVFWFEDHMAVVHSHDGESHAHDEAIEVTKESKSEKNTNLLIQDLTTADHIVTKENPVPFAPLLASEYVTLRNTSLSHLYLQSDYPPPKA